MKKKIQVFLFVCLFYFLVSGDFSKSLFLIANCLFMVIMGREHMKCIILYKIVISYEHETKLHDSLLFDSLDLDHQTNGFHIESDSQ